MRNSFGLTIPSTLAFVLLSVSGLSAQSLWNAAGPLNWSNAGNWNPNGTPDNTTDVEIRNGGTARVNGPQGPQSAKSVQIGVGGGTGNLWVQAAGTLTVAEQIDVGRSNTGSLLVRTGGILTTAEGRIGLTAGGNGTVLVEDAGSQWINTGANFVVARDGTGTLTVRNGGLVRVLGGLGTVEIARNAGSVGIVNIGSPAADPASGPGTIQAATITGGAGTATLNFNHNDAAFQFLPAITGSINVEQRGSDTQLDAVNTYSGTTTITGGSLNAGINGAFSSNSAFTVDAFGTLNVVGTTQSIGSIAGTGSLDLGTGSLTVGSNNSSTTFDGQIAGQPAGSLTKVGTGTFTLAGSNTYQGLTTVSAGTLAVSNSSGLGTADSGTIVADGAALHLQGGITVVGEALTLNGQGDGGSGGALRNQSGDNIWTGLVTLDSTTRIQATGGSSLNLSGGIVAVGSNLTLAGAGNIFIDGLDLGGGSLTKLGLGTSTLTGTASIAGGTTIENGTLQIGNGGTSGSISGDILNNAAIIFNRSDAISYSNQISGIGSLTKLGTGTLTLDNLNTYSGLTTISEGTLVIQHESALGTNAAGTIVANGATLELQGGMTVAGEALTISGQGVSNNGALRSASGANDWTGLITLDSNSRINAAAGSIFNLSGGVTANNHNLRLGGAGDIIVSGLSLGTGSLTRAGAGTATLIGNISYSGGTTISSGTLQVGNGGTTGSISGNVSNSSILIFNRSDNLGYSGQITGTGSLEKLGAGRLTLTGANNFSGGTTITEGILRIGNGGTSGSITGNILNNAALVFNRSNDLTYAGNMSGTGTLTKQGAGDLLLTGVNTHSGKTLVSEGRIDANSAFTLSANSELEIASGATVRIISGTQQTIGSLSGAGQMRVSFLGSILNVGAANSDTVYLGILTGNNEGVINKIGTGSLTLTSPSNYGGAVNVNNGTLRTQNATALGTGPVSINAGSLQPVGTLSINSLDWTGGTIASNLGTDTSFVDIAGNLNLVGGGQFVFSADGGFLGNTPYLILSSANLDDTMLAQFSGNSLFGINPTFTRDSTDLFVTFTGASDGPFIQNTAPIFTPANADFIINGPVTTGGPLDSNTVNSLTFNPNSSLRVFNNLTVASGNFNVPSGRASINGGNVITPGDFNKNGLGTLDTTGSFGVGGAANVNAGALLVNGSFTAGGGLTVMQNALLGGSGIINGNVFNNGIVNPGNSPGTLTINGNFTQSSSGTLQIEAASLSNFDRLIVSGRANLAGTLQFLPLSGFRPAYGQQFAFLQANGGISGTFSSILVPATFRGRFINQGNVGILLLAPDTYTRVATNQNQFNVARALDSFIPQVGNDQEVVSTALDFLTEEQYPAAFDQIMPSFHETVANIGINLAQSQGQLMQQQLSSVRLGGRGFRASNVPTEPLTHDKGGQRVADPKNFKSEVAMESPSSLRWSVWAQGNGIFARTTTPSAVPSYRFESGGFLAGADYEWSESFVTGLFAGYQGLYAKYTNGADTKMNGVRFGGYATYDPVDSGFYADAVVWGGASNYKTRRKIQFSTIDRTASANQDSGEFSTLLGGGYDWQVGNFTFGPAVSAQYTYFGIAPFTESGADSLNLRVGQQNANSLQSYIGGRIAYTAKLTDTILLIPEVRMFWQHEFLNNPRTLNASLNGGGGPGFGYRTQDPSRDAVWAGAGATIQFGERVNTYFYYNADFGRQDYISHVISAGLGLSF